MKKKALACVIIENDNYIFDFLFTGGKTIRVSLSDAVEEIKEIAEDMACDYDDFEIGFDEYGVDYTALCKDVCNQVLGSMRHNIGTEYPEIVRLFSKVFVRFVRDYFFSAMIEYYYDEQDGFDWADYPGLEELKGESPF